MSRAKAWPRWRKARRRSARGRQADQIFGAVDGQHGEQSLPSAAALIRFAPCFSTAERRPGAMLLSRRRHRDRRILKRAPHPYPVTRA